MTDLLNNPSSFLALVGLFFCSIGFIFIRREKITNRQLVFSALMLALAVLLQQLRLFHMPQGGSVTAGAMLPLLLVSFIYGPALGMLTGFVYGFLNMLLDPYILHPIQVLFDYPLPFMAMGLAGFFRSKLLLGTAIAFLARFICHFLSGIIFFANFAPEGMPAWLYSLGFNGSFLSAEFIICIILLKLLPIARIIKAVGDFKS